jgi:hypothetical protein
MERSSIPSCMPRWLRRHPVLLTAAIAAVNRLRRCALAGRRASGVLAAVSIGAASTLLVVFAASGGRAALAMHWLLSHAGLVIAVAGSYAAMQIARRRRDVETARRASWLVATPRVEGASGAATAALVLLPLFGRFSLAVGVSLGLSLDRGVTIAQALELDALLVAGAAGGALGGWWLLRRSTAQAAPGSRYTIRPRQAVAFAPSSGALSRWPIAQAFAWRRPENSRLILLAAILTVPGGTGLLGSMCLLAMWVVGSYLAALVVAVPHAARRAVEWLRSTPIGFWSFAWPLARRALAHQLCGTFAGMGVMLLLGSSLAGALYAGVLWMAIVVLTAALGLADSYRARSPAVKATLSVLAALLAEQLARGWGIALALLLAAWHLRRGGVHARA